MINCRRIKIQRPDGSATIEIDVYKREHFARLGWIEVSDDNKSIDESIENETESIIHEPISEE